MSIKLSDLSINIPETIGETVLLVEEPRPYFNYIEGVKGSVAGNRLYGSFAMSELRKTNC